MSLAKKSLRFLKEEFSDEEELMSDSEYDEEEMENDNEEDFFSDEEQCRGPLRDDQIYQDNGYDSSFDIPGGYDEYTRMRKEDAYGLYENRKHKHMKESANRKVIRRK